MGSFNIACSLSKQNIRPGAPCYVALIYRTNSQPVEIHFRGKPMGTAPGMSFSSADPNAHWRTHGHLLLGTYDDSGAVIVDNSPQNLKLLAYTLEPLVDGISVNKNSGYDLQAHLQAKPELYNLMNSGDFKAPGRSYTQEQRAQLLDTWAYLQDSILNRQVFTFDMGAPSIMQTCVMHKGAVDALVELSSTWGIDGLRRIDDPLTHALESGIRYMKDYAEPIEHESVQAAFDLIIANVTAVRLSTQPAAFAQVSQELRNRFLMLAQGFRDGYLESMSRYCGPGGLNQVLKRHLSSELHQLMRGEITWTAFFDELLPVVLQGKVNRAMFHMHLKYEPAAYAGQGHENFAGQAYAAFIQKATRRVGKTARDEDGDSLAASARPRVG